MQYNLPELAHELIPNPIQSGRWEKIDNLDALASDLRIGAENIHNSLLKSIPDAWAQIQLFSQALLNPGHEAHTAVTDQWRGILALLALQPTFAQEYNLSITTFDTRATGEGNRLFRSTLNRLIPSASLSGTASWSEIGFIELHIKTSAKTSLPAITVGILSPFCMVAAGKSFSLGESSDIPWVSANGIADPVSCSGLSSDIYSVLENYLRNLTAHVVQQQTPDRFASERTRLLEALNQYADECSMRARGALPLRAKVLPLKWPNPLFAILGSTFEVDTANVPIGKSDCVLPLRDFGVGVQKVVRSMILYDPNLARTLNRDASAIRIWEQYTLADAERKETLAKIKALAAENGSLVVTPDDLLTNKLARLNDGSKVRAHGPTTEEMLLPISPLMLLLQDPVSLAESSLLQEVSGESRFSLKLNVLSGTTLVSHYLERTYPAQYRVDYQGPSDLAIWPNFERKGWPFNFLRFQYSTQGELQARFALSGEMLAADVRESSRGTAAAKGEALQSWAASDLVIDHRICAGAVSAVEGVVSGAVGDSATGDPKILFRRFQFANVLNVATKSKLIGEQQQLSLGIEAIFFATDGSPREAAGCVLVRRPEAPGNDTGAIISLDFGSTSTITYAKVGSTVKQLSFADRIFRPIQVKNENQRIEFQSAAYTDFFPPAGHTSPFPTILKKREFEGAAGNFEDNEAGADSIGVRNMIFFNPSKSNGGEGPVVQWLREDRLVSDIKWSSSAETRYQTARFLLQTMIMSSAELVGSGIRPSNISWRLSYPQSFDGPRIAQFKAAVTDAVGDLGPVDAKLDFKTEGEAAAHYFMRERVAGRPSRLLVILDIGGSTTDLAFRFDSRLVWRGSARIAGRAFFTNYLASNPALLLGVNKTLGAALDGKDLGADVPAQLVELFLGNSSFTKEFDERYKFAADEPAWAGLRHSVSVAVGGLLYYAGMTLRGLLGRGEIEGLDEAAIGEASIAFGGRGSHYLRRFQADGRLQDIMNMLAWGADISVSDAHFNEIFSDQPKHEVALGLLEERSDQAGSHQVSSYLPIGETLEYRLATMSTLDRFDDVTSMPGGSASLVECEPKQLQRFLEGLKKHASLDVDLSIAGNGANALSIVRSKTHATLRNARIPEGGKRGETQDAVPPFIEELSRLVAILASSNENRKSLSVVG